MKNEIKYMNRHLYNLAFALNVSFTTNMVRKLNTTRNMQ